MEVGSRGRLSHVPDPAILILMTSTASTAISVRVLLFARFAELAGTDVYRATVRTPATVADVLDVLRAALPGAGALPERPLCALNAEQARLEDLVADGDEVAVLPPLAGG